MDEERNPLIDNNDEAQDEDDDEETSRPFQDDDETPETSGEQIEMTSMNKEKVKDSETAETSFIEGDTYSRVLLANKNAWDALKSIFPDAKATELEASYSKKGRLQVKMLGKGKRFYSLYTDDRKTREQRLNPNIRKETKKALGLTRQELIDEKDEEIEELKSIIIYNL